MRDTSGPTGAEPDVDAGHHVTYDPRTDDVAATVVEATAAARDVDPMDVPPLSDTLDPDVLSTLFSESSGGRRLSDGRLVFAHGGCVVTITSDGHVRVRPSE